MNELTERLTLLAILAHPHDFTHLAGTCAHHAERKDRVCVASVTGSASGSPKAQRMAQVCELFGIHDSRLLGFEDSPLTLTDLLVRSLADVLIELRPHILMTHAPSGFSNRGRTDAPHPDHNCVGDAVQRSVSAIATGDAARPPHQVAAIYYTAIEFDQHEADLLVDVTDQVSRRIRAEMLFANQADPQLVRKRVEISAGAWGWASGVGYAEPFIRARREVGTHLTVTHHDLQTSAMTPKDRFLRMCQMHRE